MEASLRAEAKRLLESEEVAVVIGYEWNKKKTYTTPAFITKPEETDRLVFNQKCVNNLSIYLTRKYKDIQAMGRPAIVAKGCDIKNIAVCISEGQFKRHDVYIIGVTCEGVAYKQELLQGDAVLTDKIKPVKCLNCDVRNPHITDVVIGEESTFVPPEEPVGIVYDKIKEIDKMDAKARWDFWMAHFKRCIKCYACRQACSLCYCERCITDKNMPQWVETSATPRGNLSWNLIRAQHLTGRCTFCGECERSCPANIPLNIINQKMELTVRESFGYRSGYDPDEHPPMIVFKEDDRENFIK